MAADPDQGVPHCQRSGRDPRNHLNWETASGAPHCFMWARNAALRSRWRSVCSRHLACFRVQLDRR